MGLYARYIFPWVIEYVMSRRPLTEQRPRVLSQVTGSVLEIGFGTGLNLPHYPPHVERLTVLDPNAGMLRLARRRSAAARLKVEFIGLIDGKNLPIPANTFDSVVSTWTLCTIPDVAHALMEVCRVLKPGGRFFFIEHGLSRDRRIAAWQHRLNGVSKCLGAGCNLDRDIAALIGSSPLSVGRCEEFYMPMTPRIGGYTYRGVARKE